MAMAGILVHIPWNDFYKVCRKLMKCNLKNTLSEMTNKFESKFWNEFHISLNAEVPYI